MYDVIIIGGGPAGVSASLYSKRSNLNVLLIYNDISNLEKAVKIDNYYGFPDGISGNDLFQNGLTQAKNLGVEILKDEITGIENLGSFFNIETPNNKFEGKTVIIATGNKKNAPPIKGLKEFEGKGISYCAICDAFFFRNKKIGVIGNGNFALSEANTLKNVTDKITIFTDGKNLENKTDFAINTKKIKEIHGDLKVSELEFEDGSKEDIDGLFIAYGEASAIDFAKTLGILVEGNNIKVTDKMETNVKGIFACGNITGGLLQVNKAVYEGAVAGLSATKYIKENN